jgi:hypothetical protein
MRLDGAPVSGGFEQTGQLWIYGSPYRERDPDVLQGERHTERE